MKSFHSDRLAGSALFLLAVAYLFEARSFQVGFIADPIGPRAFPYVIGSLLAVLGAWLAAHPGEEGDRPVWAFWRRWFSVSAAFFVYAAALRWLGFLISTVALVGFISSMLGARARSALLFALLLSAATWVLFRYLLAVPLPVGEIWSTLLVGGAD